MTLEIVPDMTDDALTTPLWRRAVIDLTAVEDNVRLLKQQAGVEEFIAVVKANGYGHGALEVAQAAIRGGATRIGVADLQEAQRLVTGGIDTVPVLAWLHPPTARFDQALSLGVEIGVSSAQQLHDVVAARANDKPARIHVKLETGLGRGGAAPATWERLFEHTAQLVGAGEVELIGMFSHLSGTSAAEDLRQLDRFEHGVAMAAQYGLNPPLRHIAATAATISLPSTRLNAVRVGLGIYGLSPFEDRQANALGLRPAMTLQAPIIATRDVPAGQGVSYGYDYRTTQPTRLALVPLGYADGIPRQASTGGIVSINGRTFPVAGRIAMDQFVVDVGDAVVQVGDVVTVFGASSTGPTADAWAAAAGTINYDVVTRIGHRVSRVYQDNKTTL